MKKLRFLCTFLLFWRNSDSKEVPTFYANPCYERDRYTRNEEAPK